MTDKPAESAVERGTIRVFPDGLPVKWFKFIDEELKDSAVGGMAPEGAMLLASAIATDAFITIEIWASEAVRLRAIKRDRDAALTELKAERDAARSAQKKAQRRADQLEAAMNDALKHPNRKQSHAVEAGYKLAQRDVDELKAENESLRRELEERTREMDIAARLIELYEEMWAQVDEDHVGPGLYARFNQAQSDFDAAHDQGGDA